VNLQLWDLAPGAYAPHPLHAVERTWPESNCYVDLWIELLHASGIEPRAALPFALTVDLEGDQWTFIKFPLADLELLYGVRVFELNVWRPLVEHIVDQLAQRRPTIVEVDAFYLPDTAGTSYHLQHVKTSIAIQAIDVAGKRLGYFHNAGYYELSESDFSGVFRLDGHAVNPEYLPPYVEVAKLPLGCPAGGARLRDDSLALLRSHLARRPAANPFVCYATRFRSDLEWLATEPLSSFHSYAFATLRQCGAAFELAGAYFRWLEAGGECGLEPVAEACDRISTAAKTLQFKTARVVNAQRPIDPTPMLDTMTAAWDDVMMALTSRYGAERRLAAV
jgi:hypothetical protein